MSNKSLTVQRANVILHVAPEQLDYYMSQGYNVIDDAGNVIKASVPRDLGTLQKAFVDNQKKIAELEAEIQALKKPKQERKQRKIEK